MNEPSNRHRVVIAGAGVAGLEALTALHALAGDRVEMTVLDPGSEFVLQALSVADPFAVPGTRRYELEAICADHGARHVSNTLAEVLDDRAAIRTGTGDEIAYDSLVIALGVRREPVYPRALTFRDARDGERLHGLIQDLEGGYVHDLAFVVPPVATWPLPLYELALMTAQRADSLGLRHVKITVVTAEVRPLAAFGHEGSQAIADALATAGIRLITSTGIDSFERGRLRDAAGTDVVAAERVVALPRLVPPVIPGIASDGDGFILTDPFGRVEGLRGVYAAGDATTQPVKQGGVAAQQGAVAAKHIAMRAGADLAPLPIKPVLRAQLFTGGEPLFLRLTSPSGRTNVSGHALWWPPAKIVAPHLSAYLAHRDAGRRGPARDPALAVVHGTGDPAGPIELLGD